MNTSMEDVARGAEASRRVAWRSFYEQRERASELEDEARAWKRVAMECITTLARDLYDSGHLNVALESLESIQEYYAWAKKADHVAAMTDVFALLGEFMTDWPKNAPLPGS